MDRTDIIQYLIQWKKRGKAPPVNVELHPTYKCNSKCIFCIQRATKYNFSEAMEKEKWLSIIRELAKMGVKKLQISGGGEPMTVPETTMNMMELIKQFDIEGKINTNGTLWDEEKLRKAVNLHWDKIIFSIDGPDAKTHDFLRGVPGFFERAIKNVRMLNKIKKDNGKKLPIIEFNMVITKFNYYKIKDMIKLAQECGCESITAEPVFITMKYVKKMRLSKKQRIQFNEHLREASELAKRNNITTNFEGLIEVERLEKTGEMEEIIEEKYSKIDNKDPFFSAPCFEPLYFPKIGPNGEYGPCCNYPYSQSKINLKNKTFKEVWLGEEVNNFRESIMKKELSEVCSNCTATRIAINTELREQLLEKWKEK
jgi:radical SAM protein with 4Fe4S-binding SPASM domain